MSKYAILAAAALALAACGQGKPETAPAAPADAPRAGSLEDLRKENCGPDARPDPRFSQVQLAQICGADPAPGKK